ncbi:MAG: hypothetical protein KJ880_00060 [Candidatus Omnitrophica bacterium]|nr:hypothetical protein [Candidatus Omnitrophota bacterium]
MDNLFDRKNYLELLKKRVSSLKDGYRQNIAIVGDEFVGKTSIIYKFLSQYYDTRTVILYLDIRLESVASFTKRFIAVLLYNFLANSDTALKEDLDFLILRSEKYIPKTIERVRAILNAAAKRKKNNILTELLSLCDTINQETGKSCVVIFDEFHNLELLGIKGIYREWSKLLISQKNTMYIITSSAKYRTKEILSKELALLFGNFELVTVEPFDIKTSKEYLTEKIGSLNLDPGLFDFIIHFTGGFPLYLKIITETLIKSPKTGLTEILENLLFDASGILNQRFSNYIKRFTDLPKHNDYLSTLYLIASGKNKIKEIAHILKKPIKLINQKVARLLELDTITRNGDFLKINDRVFAFWLRFVYQEKIHSLTFDTKDKQQKFMNNIKEAIQEFLTNSQKSVIERIEELLRLFEDDTIQIERKKLRLNHFREIKPLEFNRGCLKTGLLGRSAESLWIMGYKFDSLTEEDVSEFSKECKKYHHKLQRKIIFTLNEIDSNTRLKALEEKVLAWDINHINSMLDLYSKPWLIK